MTRITPLDQEILAWYESQTEELLRDLYDRFGAQTPRQAWMSSFNDCAFPAQQSPGDSLAAPAEAGQGVCNHLAAARTVQWLLGELFCLAEDGTLEEVVLLNASNTQDMRVIQLERLA